MDELKFLELDIRTDKITAIVANMKIPKIVYYTVFI